MTMGIIALPEESCGHAGIQGILERYDDGCVIGWVWCPSKPSARVALELYVNGAPAGLAIANILREDVRASGRGDGYYGFHAPLRANAGERVRVAIANSEQWLPGELVVEKSFESRTTGRVDTNIGLTIRGWAWDPSTPDGYVRVLAKHDNEIVAETRADEYREDVSRAKIGLGNHAFTIKLPVWLADGTARSIEVVTADGHGLPGSPVTVQISRDRPSTLLHRLNEAYAGNDRGEAIRISNLLAAYLQQAESLLPDSLPWHSYPAWRKARGIADVATTPHTPLDFVRITSLSEPLTIGIIVDNGAAPLQGSIQRALQLFVEMDSDVLFADAEVEAGNTIVPWFRPDWSFDHFLALDYTRGIFLFRPDLLAEKVFPSAAAIKLAAIAAARPGHIAHVPEILTRLEPTSNDGGEWLNAVGVHLARFHSGATVEPWESNGRVRRIRWPLPRPLPRVTLIVPTRDRLDLLRTCIDSIKRLTTYPSYDIIVINNRSVERETHQYLSWGEQHGVFSVINYDAPFNFSEMNNIAAQRAQGDILGFINNDVELLSPQWLEEAVSLLGRKEIGAVGARLRFGNGMLQHAGVILGVNGLAENAFQHAHMNDDAYFGRTQAAGDYSAVTAACMFCRSSTFRNVGGFDAENLPIAFNDVDFCLRLRERGYRIIWTPYIDLFHAESASRGHSGLAKERQGQAFKEEAYMRGRWHASLMRDPFYNPNLNLDVRPYTGIALFPRTNGRGVTGRGGEVK